MGGGMKRRVLLAMGICVFGALTACTPAEAPDEERVVRSEPAPPQPEDDEPFTTHVEPPQPSGEQAVFTGPWFDPEGEVVSNPDGVYKVSHSVGPSHCGWESSVVLAVHWPPGSAYDRTKSPKWRQYLRDPEGVVPVFGEEPEPGPTLDLDAALPKKADYSGLYTEDIELWFGQDGGDRYAYLVGRDHTERWPRRQVGCD
jgi:hypothetical protein